MDLTFDNLSPVTHAHDLRDHECATSLISCTLSGDPNTYYCVGTAYVFPEEAEPKTGRLILFQLVEGKEKNNTRYYHLSATNNVSVIILFHAWEWVISFLRVFLPLDGSLPGLTNVPSTRV